MVTREQKEKYRTRRVMLATFFYDVSKISFAGTVIGGMSPIVTGGMDPLNWITSATGLLVAVVFAVLANYILKK